MTFWIVCFENIDGEMAPTKRCQLPENKTGWQEPILRLRNLQLQRQRCSRARTLFKVEENFFRFQNALGYP
jgi:hypothetical protein